MPSNESLIHNNSKYIVHLSDLHFQKNWEENLGIVLKAFFSDLKKQLFGKNPSSIFFVFSGDIVKKGSEEDSFRAFEETFRSYIEDLQIPFDNLIIIPGNHDLSQSWVADNKDLHGAMVAKNWKEREFNDYLQKQDHIFIEKFGNFQTFQKRFTAKNTINDFLTGNLVTIDESIELFCANSAICSSGGFNKIDDQGKLGLSTREIMSWVLNSKAKVKILAMHHPLEWLTEWAQESLEILLRNGLDLLLTGHKHDQDCFKINYANSSAVVCSAPPLHTDKSDNLGYAIIELNQNLPERVVYRQWIAKGAFTTGVNFSGTDNGIVMFNYNSQKETVKTVEVPGETCFTQNNLQNSSKNVLFEVYRRDCEPFYIERELDKCFTGNLKQFNIWLYGSSGAGKTCLAFRNLYVSKLPFIEIYLGSCLDESYLSWFKVIIDELATQGKVDKSNFQTGNFRELCSGIIEILEKIKEKVGAFVVLIEEIPLEKQDDYQAFVPLISSLLIAKQRNPNLKDIRFVLSTFENPKVHLLTHQKKCLQEFKFLHLTSWIEEDFCKLFEMILENLDFSFTSDFEVRLKQVSLFLPRFLKKFFRNKLAANALNRTDEEILLETAEELRVNNE